MLRIKPFSPEPLTVMRARFNEAIRERMASSEDLRCLDDCHFFDFDDGYRLNITRDVVEEGEFITVAGGPVGANPLWPVTLIAARLALHFAELTDHAYGQSEVVLVEPGLVVMAFKYAEPQALAATGL